MYRIEIYMLYSFFVRCATFLGEVHFSRSYKRVSQNWLHPRKLWRICTSGIEEGNQALPLFLRISNMSRHVLSRLSIYFLYHKFIHTFIYTFICTFIHTFIHTFRYTFIYTFVRTFIHTFIRTYKHTKILLQSSVTHFQYILYAQFLTCCPHRIVLVI